MFLLFPSWYCLACCSRLTLTYYRPQHHDTPEVCGDGYILSCFKNLPIILFPAVAPEHHRSVFWCPSYELSRRRSVSSNIVTLGRLFLVYSPLKFYCTFPSVKMTSSLLSATLRPIKRTTAPSPHPINTHVEEVTAAEPQRWASYGSQADINVPHNPETLFRGCDFVSRINYAAQRPSTLFFFFCLYLQRAQSWIS